jgi:trehalose/maltose hydrolase-like predicted phosphorylase
LALRFLWRGARLALALTPDTAKITVLSSKSKSLKIRVFGRVQSLDTGKQYTFRREEKQVYGFYY